MRFAPRLTISLDFGMWASIALMLTVALATAARSFADSSLANVNHTPRIGTTHQPEAENTTGATFTAIRIEIETAAPLAAYQLELTADGDASLVGVESGEHPAFAEAPYYDPKALGGGRIIIAAMNTGDDLPSGRTRICRLHFRTAGNVKYNAALITAAGPDGNPIEAQLHIVEE